MRIVTIAAAAAFMAGSLMAAEHAGAAIRRYELNIPRQPLDAALKDLADQTGLQIGRLTDRIEGSALVGPIKGNQTPEQALSALLANEDLEYKIVSDNVIAIVDASEGPTATVSDEETGIENDEVVVTGSRIKRENMDGPQDVQVYSKQQIQQSGQSTLAEFLNTLPDVSVSSGETGFNTLSGATTVQVHGFPVGSTLVLINGRRVESSAMLAVSGSNFFDLNTLPVSAIERVEMVPEGTSAVYGSDAIAGVVNIILRKDFDGAEANIKYGGASGTEEKNISLALGKAWTDGSVSLIASLQTRNQLYNGARSITADANYTRFGGSDNRTTDCPLANVYSLDGSNLPGTNSPYAAVAAGSAAGNYRSIPGQLNKCTRTTAVLPSTNRQGLLLEAHYDINPAVTVFMDALYSRVRQTQYGQLAEVYGAPGYQQYTVGAENPYNPYGEAVGISQAWAAAPAYAMPTDAKFFRPLVGLRGSFLYSWDWELAAWQSTDWDHALQTGYPTFSSLQDALNSSDPAVALNPFIDGPVGSERQLQTLVPPLRLSYRGQNRSANGFVRGPLLRLPAGELEIVAGAEYDRDYFYSDNINDPYGTLGVEQHQRAGSGLFGEARIPILARHPEPHGAEVLAVSIAGRYDHDAQFGGATTPQYGIEWRPVRSLLVRANYGKSFKEPSLVNLYQPITTTTNTIVDPLRGNQTYAVTGYNGGNPDLQPERGDSRTAGFVYSSALIPDLQFGATWWSVREAGNIQNFFPSDIVANASVFADRIVRAETCSDGPPCPITGVYSGYQNFGHIEVTGLDYRISCKFSSELGTWSPSLAATDTYRYLSALTPNAPVTDATNRGQDSGNWAPRWKATAALSWNKGAFTAHVDSRWVGPYYDYDGADRMIGNFWLTDAVFRYGISELLERETSHLKDSYIEIGGVNLFNRLPQYSNFAGGFLGYDPYQADLRGRFLYVRAGVQL